MHLDIIIVLYCSFSFNPENEPFIIYLKEHSDFEIIGTEYQYFKYYF